MTNTVQSFYRAAGAAAKQTLASTSVLAYGRKKSEFVAWSKTSNPLGL
jgi:hypothetical protein